MGVVQEPVRSALPVYWATCPVMATMGAASNAAIVDGPGAAVTMASTDCEAIDAEALMMALAISEEAFAAHPTKSGIVTLAAAHVCRFNSAASDGEFSMVQCFPEQPKCVLFSSAEVQLSEMQQASEST